MGVSREAGASKRRCFYGGVLLISASLLGLEIVQTRLLSLITWYYLAFFSISMAMFGMTLGAMRIYLSPRRFDAASLPRQLPRFAFFAGLAIVICCIAEVSLASHSIAGVAMVLASIRLAITLAIPFYFGGVALTLALMRSPFPVGATYGTDLLGAGVGCLAALLLMTPLGGPGAVFALAAAAFGAAWCFAQWGGDKRYAVASLVAALAALAMGFANSRTAYGVSPNYIKGRLEARDEIIYEKWNSFSRIVAGKERSGGPEGKALWVGSKRVVYPDSKYIPLSIDGYAGTNMIKMTDGADSVAYSLYDITSQAYFLRRGRVAVIGVGGGKDIMAALAAGNDAAVGIELNEIFLHLHRGLFRDYSKIAADPRVHFVFDEARSYLARNASRYDIIQASLIDTWAATGAGAYSLSENSLYTVEAWTLFLNRLTANGVFTVSRWFSRERVDETSRVISLAVASLFRVGARHPAEHIFLTANGNLATVIVGAAPFAAADVEHFLDVNDRLGFDVLAAPGREPQSAILRSILAAKDEPELVRAAERTDYDLTPPTDERPFFFYMLKLRQALPILAAWFRDPERGRGVISGNALATFTLMLLLLIALGCSAIILLVPLARASRLDRPSGRDVLYFTAIGFGFMFAEIAFLQRFSMYLGHPIYSLAVVLFSLILSTGIGSLANDRLAMATPGRVRFWAMATFAYLALAGWLSKVVPALFPGWPTPGRIAVCIAILAPAGFAMGQAFPTGIKLARAGKGDPAPWLWGVNGAAGVTASVAAVAVSIGFGITVTLWCGACCYLLLAFAAPAKKRSFP